jgi:hypothetical protein
MNTKAIERIKGFCCEVDEEQLEAIRNYTEVRHGEFMTGYPFVFIDGNNELDGYKNRVDAECAGLNVIPYPDFLAKMKGEEKWEPKYGEQVEVKIDGKWYERKYIGFEHGRHFVWSPPRSQYYAEPVNQIRQVLTEITRTEAEQLLNKRIID